MTESAGPAKAQMAPPDVDNQQLCNEICQTLVKLQIVLILVINLRTAICNAVVKLFVFGL